MGLIQDIATTDQRLSLCRYRCIPILQVEAAAKALWRLSEAEQNVGPIMWSGGLVQMLHVLGPVNGRRHPSSVVCEAVIRALACLTMASEEAAGVIIRTGVFVGCCRLVIWGSGAADMAPLMALLQGLWRVWWSCSVLAAPKDCWRRLSHALHRFWQLTRRPTTQWWKAAAFWS